MVRPRCRYTHIWIDGTHEYMTLLLTCGVRRVVRVKVHIRYSALAQRDPITRVIKRRSTGKNIIVGKMYFFFFYERHTED